MRFKIYHFLLFAILFVLVYTFRFSNSAFDIQMHDTYFVIACSHLGIAVSLILGFIALVYHFFDKKNIELNKWLTVIHVFVTLLFFYFLLTELFKPRSYHYVEPQRETIKFIQGLGRHLLEFILILSFAQIVFFINLVIGVLKKYINR